MATSLFGNIDFLIYGLIPLNLILYGVLLEGYLRQRRIFKIPKVSSADEAFSFFESSYKQTFPEDREGFTWREAVVKAGRMAQLKEVEWDRVQQTLHDYEVYRYSDTGEGEIGVEEKKRQEERIDSFPILKLSIALRENTFSITKWEKWRKHQ